MWAGKGGVIHDGDVVEVLLSLGGVLRGEAQVRYTDGRPERAMSVEGVPVRGIDGKLLCDDWSVVSVRPAQAPSEAPRVLEAGSLRPGMWIRSEESGQWTRVVSADEFSLPSSDPRVKRRGVQVWLRDGSETLIRADHSVQAIAQSAGRRRGLAASKDHDAEAAVAQEE